MVTEEHDTGVIEHVLFAQLVDNTTDVGVDVLYLRIVARQSGPGTSLMGSWNVRAKRQLLRLVAAVFGGGKLRPVRRLHRDDHKEGFIRVLAGVDTLER